MKIITNEQIFEPPWSGHVHASTLLELKDGGFLIFKWNETDIPVSKILALTDHKPILGHRVGKLNKTHWILFMK